MRGSQTTGASWVSTLFRAELAQRAGGGLASHGLLVFEAVAADAPQ